MYSSIRGRDRITNRIWIPPRPIPTATVPAKLTPTIPATPTPSSPVIFHGLAVGDWATWAAAVAALLSFAIVAFGLYVERRNRAGDIKREGKDREEDIERIENRQKLLDERQRKLDEQSVYLLESEQARKIAAFISLPPDAQAPEDRDVAEMTVINASDLPISDIRGYIISVKNQKTVSAFPQVPVIYPHKDDKQQTYVEPTSLRNDQKLVFVYNDDSGLRWRKYLDERSPSRLKDGASDLPWGTTESPTQQ